MDWKDSNGSLDRKLEKIDFLKEFKVEHRGYIFEVTVWNGYMAPCPTVLYDYNNVLNTFPMEELQKAAGTERDTYAIVSLLGGKGYHFKNLEKRASENNECIVAITGRIRGNRVEVETSLKYNVVKKLHWTSPRLALDDKPHEWFNPDLKQQSFKDLKMDHHKKPVFKVDLSFK